MLTVVSAAAVVEGKTVVMGLMLPFAEIEPMKPLPLCLVHSLYPSPSHKSRITLSAPEVSTFPKASPGRTGLWCFTPRIDRMVEGTFERQYPV